MIIKALVENTSISEDLGSEHGLSIYIEANNRKLLLDVGASELFYENARKLDVNIDEVDNLVLSHGHYDHGGGLKTFLNANSKAQVFIHNNAFDKQYALRKNNKYEYIGLDENLKNDERIIFTQDYHLISEGIYVFSNVTQVEPGPKTNKGLLTEYNGKMVEDTFIHEQNLVIDENGKLVLFTGCAHNGIVNILEHFNKLMGHMPDYVIGGFHLSSRIIGNESPETIDKISKYLVDTKARFYTCHCTGIDSYNRLKRLMGESIDYLSTGNEIVI